MKLGSTLWTLIPLTLLPACGGGGGGHSGAAPSGLQYSESFSVYMVDESHVPLTPSVTGSVSDWSIAPALPSGLLFDPLTGEITGTPHVSAPRQRYSIRAANSAGSTQTLIEFSVEKPQRYAYVTSPDDRSISILALDASSGAVTRRGFVAGQPWEGLTECFVPNTTRPFGYSTSREGFLTTWAIDEASGWLTELDTLALDLGDHALALTPDGRYLLVANRDGNSVSVYYADSPNGFLIEANLGAAVAAQPLAIAIDASGTRVAVASAGDASSHVGSTLTLLALEPEQGVLTVLGSMLLNGARPASCAFSPNQNSIYIGLPQVMRLLAVSFDSGTGEMLSLGSVFSGDGCGALALDPLGRQVWTVNETAGTLASFHIQPNGSLLAASTIPAGSAPSALAIDPLGRYLFSLDRVSQSLGQFELDQDAGTAVPGASWGIRTHPVHVSFGRGEHALSASCSGMLAAGFGSSDLTSHPIDVVSGAVGTGVAVPTGTGPLSVTVEPRQRFAFTGNTQEKSIGIYRIDPQTGALSASGPAQITNGTPICVAADASGRFLYVALREVADPTDGFVAIYAIDAATGALTLQGTSPSGFEPNWLGVNPTGQFLYVANTGNGTPGSATIALFRLSAATGLPTGPATSVPAPGVWSLGFHPGGRFLYAALRDSNQTLPFQISQTDGSLSPVGSGVGTAVQPVSVSVTPDGRFAYVAYQNAGGPGTIGLYAIDAQTGALISPASPFLDGIAPLDLRVDVTGRFLYSANSGTDSLSAFAIQSTDGFLQPLTPVPTGLVPSAIALLQRWQ